MKAFKRVFLAAALLSSVPVLTLLAPSAYAQQDQRWRVLVDAPINNSGLQFLAIRDVESRAIAAGEVEYLRDFGCTGVHAVPERAFKAQEDAGIAAVGGTDEEACPGTP
jgi:hypothetical protein